MWKSRMRGRYGASGWVGTGPAISAPFHTCVPTEKGLRALAGRSGLEVFAVKGCNPPIIGATLLHWMHRRYNLAVLIGLALYPAQWLAAAITGRPDAVAVLMRRPSDAWNWTARGAG